MSTFGLFNWRAVFQTGCESRPDHNQEKTVLVLASANAQRRLMETDVELVLIRSLLCHQMLQWTDKSTQHFS